MVQLRMPSGGMFWGAIVALALPAVTCSSLALADPPPLTTGPIVTGPFGNQLQTTLEASERGLAIPFATIGEVQPAFIINGVYEPLMASYIAATGVVNSESGPEGRFILSTSFGYSLTETTTVLTTNVGGGITAVVRAGGTVLGTATAPTEAEARTQALALAGAIPHLGGRMLLNPVISGGGVIETLTETTSHMITGRDTYIAAEVYFGPDSVAVGNLGRCSRMYGTCEGGIVFNFNGNDTLGEARRFQDLYVATLIERLITSSGTEYLDFVFAANGVAHPAAQMVGFELSNRFLARMLAASGDAASESPEDSGAMVHLGGAPTGLTVLFEATGAAGDYYGHDAVASSDFDFAGVRGGLAAELGEDLIVGTVLETGKWNWSSDDTLFPEEASGNRLSGGVFASWTPGLWRINAAGFVGRQMVETSSASNLGGGMSSAEYEAIVYGAALEAGYAMPVGDWTLTPGAGISWTGWHSPAFVETGGLAPLTVEAVTSDQIRPNLGVSLGRGVDLGDGTLLSVGATGRIFGIFGDRHGSVMASDGGVSSLTSWAVEGPKEGSFGAELGAHAGLQIAPGASLTASWSSRFTGASASHAGQVGFKLTF